MREGWASRDEEQTAHLCKTLPGVENPEPYFIVDFESIKDGVTTFNIWPETFATREEAVQFLTESGFEYVGPAGPIW